jgi:protein-S-isoprenylcysteine O-methyltransferase Ste14
MAPGMRRLSALSLVGFIWFAWRLGHHGPGPAWPLALLLFSAALTMFIWTVRATARTRPSLIYDPAAPKILMRHGPYRFVRHPFYLTYLLFWTGTAAAVAGAAGWLLPLIMATLYYRAAVKEEQAFYASGMANEYAAYCGEAGMFWPK